MVSVFGSEPLQDGHTAVITEAARQRLLLRQFTAHRIQRPDLIHRNWVFTTPADHIHLPITHGQSRALLKHTHTHTVRSGQGVCYWRSVNAEAVSHQFDGQRRGLAPGVCEGPIAVDLVQKTSGHVDAAVERHGADGALRERTGRHVWPPVTHWVVTLDLQHTWWRSALNKPVRFTTLKNILWEINTICDPGPQNQS